MGAAKTKRRETKRLFLLGFFKNKPVNDTLELNGCLLFKHWDGVKERWTVDIFTPESYKAMTSYGSYH